MKAKNSIATSLPIVRLGVAPRFPKAASHLKSYTLSKPNWNREQIPALERYAEGKAGKTLRPDGKATIEFGKASLDLLLCSKALLWHAVQAALGNSKPQAQRAAKSVTAAATLKEFEKLVANGKHVHRGTPPAMLVDYFKLEKDDPNYDPKIASDLDQEISTAEFRIVVHLLLEGHAPEAIEAAIKESAPALAQRKGKRAAAYAKETLSRAIADEDLKKWTAQRAAAQNDAQQLASSGTDWLDFWRRSVAYAYGSCRMMQHSGGLQYWILEVANTAACCLALGWTDRAVMLFRQLAEGIARGQFGDYDAKKTKPFFQRRTQFFLLRMVAEWQGIALPTLPPQADDELLFCALLSHWRTPDVEILAPLLLTACDRHTHLALIRKDSPDFDTSGELTYVPFEILAVLRVREILGLSNPALDHPLMATAFGVLPEPGEPYRDALLDGVIRQARSEFPQL
jgi:hypothetical protein